MDFDKLLASKVICVVIPGDCFNKKVLELVKKLKDKKVCYVTANKGADVLLESFEKNKIDAKNFFFIDCVSKSVINPKPMPQCHFISSPSALTELSLVINRCIDKNFSVILIDSLSTFMLYHTASVITHFFHNLSNRIRAEKNKNLILIISRRDKSSEVFKKMEIIVDRVIEIK